MLLAKMQIKNTIFIQKKTELSLVRMCSLTAIPSSAFHQRPTTDMDMPSKSNQIEKILAKLNEQLIVTL
jgi:hypothetical protein